MTGVETTSAESSLRSLWRSLAKRTAVVIGAGTALVSLLVHTPVWVACLRGMAAWLAVRLVMRLAEAGLTGIRRVEGEKSAATVPLPATAPPKPAKR